MGAVYLYAITEGIAALPDGLTGVAGEPIFLLPWREIAAVAGRLPGTRPPSTLTGVCRHEDVVEAVMATAATLPMRWGTVLAGHEALAGVLETCHEAFLEALRTIRGRVELGLRVLSAHEALGPRGWRWSPQAGRPQDIADRCTAAPGRRARAAPGDGARYLATRAVEEGRREAARRQALLLTDPLYQPLRSLAAAAVRQVLPTPRTLLAAAFLVDRRRVEAFRAECATLAAGHPELRCLLTGPWPAYHFVTDCLPPALSVPDLLLRFGLRPGGGDQ